MTSVVNLLKVRGYMPSCRMLQVLLLMLGEIHDHSGVSRDGYFIDVNMSMSM